MRQLAVLDSLRPVGEILESHTCKLCRDRRHHVGASLARGDPANPGEVVRPEFAELFGKRACRLLANLMTADTGHVPDALEVFVAPAG